MRTFLKVVGYILLTLFAIELIYIVSGRALARHDIQDVLWHSFWAAGMVALGVYLVARRPKLAEKTESKSSILGIISFSFAVIGIFWWSSVLGIVAVVLAILQFRRRTTKIAIAGLSIGIVDFILAGVWYWLGMSSFIF